MNLRRIRFRLRRSVAERGALATITSAIRKCLARKVPTSEAPKEYAPVHPFDKQFGVETSGLLHAEDLCTGDSTAHLFNAGYFGVAPSAFRRMLDRLSIDFSRYTFVDLGSGKGRALLLASEYHFRAIRGVEISPSLHALSSRNIVLYENPRQQCHDIAAVLGDASRYVFPEGPLLVYMWNPFEGPIFRMVLANLEAALLQSLRDILVLYVQPNHADLLRASGHWTELWHHSFEMSEEDYAACAFPHRSEPCVAFRSVMAAERPGT